MICFNCTGTGITREGGSGYGGDRDCPRCHGTGEVTSLYLSEIAPTRFLMDAQGTAISYPKWFKLVPHKDVNVIWHRADDWILAASDGLEDTAYQMWHDEWVGAWHRNNVGHGTVWTYEYREKGAPGWNSR